MNDLPGELKMLSHIKPETTKSLNDKKHYIGVIGTLSTALRNGKNIEPIVGFMENFNFSEAS